MQDAEILAKLADIFREIFDDETVIPTAAMTAADVDAWDSLNHIRLIVATEMAFGVKFGITEITGLANVGDLVSLIRSKIQAQPTP